MRHAVAAGIDWGSEDGKFVLFRLLAVLPWPEAAPSLSGNRLGPLSAAVGRVFDLCTGKVHRLRRLANGWVRNSASSVLRIVDAFNGALAPCPVPASPSIALVAPAGALPHGLTFTHSGTVRPDVFTDDDASDTDADPSDDVSTAISDADPASAEDNCSVFGPAEASCGDGDVDW